MGIFGFYVKDSDKASRSYYGKVVVNGESSDMEIEMVVDYFIMRSDIYSKKFKFFVF